jgi:rhamnosyltransferase
MQARAVQIAEDTKNLQDPNVSIVIRSRNDSAHIRRLFADIRAQIFTGSIEIIVVDTDSRDDTAEYARSQGAKVIHITQEQFTYPKALNLGFTAATHPWVLTVVGHASLSNRLFLRSLTYWSHHQKDLGGVYGLPLANWNATIWERIENIYAPTIWKQPVILK